MIGALALPVGTVKATEDGRVLYEEESAFQYIRVVEEPDGDRQLELNEGQAVHSLYRPGSFLTGDVWDGYLVLPFTALDRPPRRVAILGNGAGTTARAYGHFFPRARVDGVEIDPELEEVGRRYFDMGSNPNLTVHNEDARPWLRRSSGGYDVIMVDAYRQPYIPFYLATREFFELVRDRLAPGGVVIANAGHPEGSDDLERCSGEPCRRSSRASCATRSRTRTPCSSPARRRPRLPASGGHPPCPGPPRPGSARGGQGRAPPSRRQRVHRRPGAGGVADRPLDPGLRGRRMRGRRAIRRI